MEVKIYYATDTDDYRQAMRIDIDGKKSFFVMDGEPEDANLSRDFNDCLGIDSLMRQAHEVGLLGERMTIEEITCDFDAI